MSGKQFLNLLEGLGISQPTHTVESLAWTCEQEGAKALVRWLCKNVSTDNVLSLDELAEYKELIHQDKVLKGEELDEAFRKLTSGSEEDVVELDDMIKQTREETDLLDDEAQNLKWRLARMQLLEASLAEQQIASSVYTADQESIVHRALDQCAMAISRLKELNDEMDSILVKVTATVQQIERNNTGEGAGGRQQLLLSSFGSFLRQNEVCQKELDRWHQKQFEGGAGREVEKNAASPMPDLASPEILRHSFSGGMPQRQQLLSRHHQRVTELERLSRTFGIAEEQRVAAVGRKAQEEASLASARVQLSAASRDMQEDESALRLKLEDLKGHLVHLQRDEKRLESQVSSLCEELAQFNDTFAFEGDYELKRRSQDYYLKRYGKFIGHLAQLLALHIVLRHAFVLDTQFHQDVRLLLTLAEGEIAAVLTASSERINCCHALEDAIKGAENSPGDVDLFPLFRRIGSLLQGTAGNTSAPILSTESVIQSLVDFEERLGAVRTQIRTLQVQQRTVALPDLQRNIAQTRALLFSPIDPHRPLFVLEDVALLFDSLESLSNSLETSVSKIQGRYKRFHQVLDDMADIMKFEREVFTLFFCNPSELLARVRDLEQRTKESRPWRRY